jgi:hypothetical protein
MPPIHAPLQAFNRGEVGAESLARIDLDRMRLSAETQVNWLPRTLGAMRLRPGLGYTATTKDNAFAVNIPFIFSATDTALLECTPGYMRPMLDGAPITRASVSTSISNGTFTNATGWTSGGDAGGTTTFTGVLTMSAPSIDSSVTVTGSTRVLRSRRATAAASFAPQDDHIRPSSIIHIAPFSRYSGLRMYFMALA